MALRFLLSLSLLVLSACAVVPRLPMDVSRAVNRDTMRVLRTEHVDLYYPAQRRAEAQALAERAEGCVAALRARTLEPGGLNGKRVELLFPDMPFNNAYVNPPSNGDFFTVVPTFWSQDIVTETGLLPDPGYVACHELTHYVQAQQTFRAFGAFNRVFGYFGTNQAGLDPWFWEGLATYYEQQLQPGTGRLAWPTWNGMFHAGIAGKTLHGGDLSFLNRKSHWGNHYLYGSHFIEFLIGRYGELRLWQLITRQGHSFFYPFIVNQRFKRVYGKTLSSLIDEFDVYLRERYPVRHKPAEQRTLRKVGMNGRFARAEDGSEALVSEAMDVPPTLSVFDADGRQVYYERLTDVLPGRKLVSPSATRISGLRFSRDAQRLYFVAVDQGAVFQRARLLELSLATRDLRVVVSDLQGLGGDVSPDGKSYLFVRVSAEGHVLSRLDLASGAVTPLYRAGKGVYLSSPNYAPDGSRIVVSAFDHRYGIWIFDATGQRQHTLDVPSGPVYDASFIDADRLLFLGPHQGTFQAFTYDLREHRATRITNAPYLVMHPRAQGGTVRFFSREGFSYTLDEVAIAATPEKAGTVSGTGNGTGTGIGNEAPPAPVPVPAPVIDPDPAHVPEDANANVNANVNDSPLPEFAPLTNATPTTDLPVLENATVSLPLPATLPVHPEDAPYRVFPRLAIPSVRSPAFTLSDNPSGNFLGAYLGGTDALGKHRWGGSLGIQPGTSKPSGSIGYLNTQLSPLWLRIDASQLAIDAVTVHERDDTLVKFHDRQLQRDLTVTALAQVRTTSFALALHGTNDQRRDRVEALHDRTLGGGTFTLYHDALERTRMSDARRGFDTSLRAPYFPEALGTLRGDVADLRGTLNVVTPLPFSRRHTFSVGVLARAILEQEAGKMLEVGGIAPGLSAHNDVHERDLSAYPGLPPAWRFREGMRGFETYAFYVDQIGMAQAQYRYPWIIDRGTATSLSILPYFFLRQLDFDLFVSAATSSPTLRSSENHLAFGGSISARAVWYGPFALRYQISKRTTDDDKLQHLISLIGDLE